MESIGIIEPISPGLWDKKLLEEYLISKSFWDRFLPPPKKMNWVELKYFEFKCWLKDNVWWRFALRRSDYD